MEHANLLWAIFSSWRAVHDPGVGEISFLVSLSGQCHAVVKNDFRRGGEKSSEGFLPVVFLLFSCSDFRVRAPPERKKIRLIVISGRKTLEIPALFVGERAVFCLRNMPSKRAVVDSLIVWLTRCPVKLTRAEFWGSSRGNRSEVDHFPIKKIRCQVPELCEW